MTYQNNNEYAVHIQDEQGSDVTVQPQHLKGFVKGIFEVHGSFYDKYAAMGMLALVEPKKLDSRIQQAVEKTVESITPKQFRKEPVVEKKEPKVEEEVVEEEEKEEVSIETEVFPADDDEAEEESIVDEDEEPEVEEEAKTIPVKKRKAKRK